MSTIITKKAISRRAVLQGMGVTLALPLLDSMVPALSAATTSPCRFGAIYLPHGLLRSHWEPLTVGADFAITPIMKPLEPFRDRLMVFSGLTAGPTVQNGGHAVAPASYLSGNIQPKQTEGADVSASITLDQVLAKAIGQQTPFPSLEVATEDFSTSIGACDTGYSCTYMNTISWANATSPLPMENNPQVVFEKLFGDGNTDAERKARRQQAVSLLDSVLGEVSSLQRKLPAVDRSRLDQYLGDIREVERRIQKASQESATDLTLPALPTGVPKDVEAHIKLMFDLQVLAWQANITRVTTLLLAKELSNAVYPKSNVRDAFHILSHHSNLRDNMDRFAVLNRYHVTLFTYLLEKLQSIPDGDGTLLDHSMVLYGSAMSDGNQHNHGPLPIILAGGASGALKGGRHMRNPKETTMSNLLVAMLDKLGVPTDKFGDSTGALQI